jgi:hypothetical protein
MSPEMRSTEPSTPIPEACPNPLPKQWVPGQRKLSPEQIDECRSLFLRGHKLADIARARNMHPGSIRRLSMLGKWGAIKADLRDATKSTIASAQSQATQAQHTVSTAVTQFLHKSLTQAERLARRGLEHGESAPDPRSYGEAVRGWSVAVNAGRQALGIADVAPGGSQGGVTVQVGVLGGLLDQSGDVLRVSVSDPKPTKPGVIDAETGESL